MKKAVASRPCENLPEYTEYNRDPIKIIVATNRKHNARSRDDSTGQGANEGCARTRVEGRKQNEHRGPKVIHEAQFERLLRTRRQTD